MAKLPDFSELTKKFDLQGLLDSVKSAVGATNTPPKAPEGDVVAAKFVKMIELAQNLATANAEQAKAIAHLHTGLNTLYKDIQAIQQLQTTATTVVTEQSTATTTSTEPTTAVDKQDIFIPKNEEKPKQD